MEKQETRAFVPPVEKEGFVKEENLRRRVLEEEVRSYKEKCRILIGFLTEAIEVIQKLGSQAQRTPRIQMMGKALVAGLAHDLRNPLAVIYSCTQSSLEAGRLSRSVRKDLEMIRQSSQMANSLLRQFLDFVKSGLQRESTDIHELLLRAWEAAHLELQSPLVRLEKRFSSDLPLILADQEKLERVFLNLLLNAIRAVASGGTVTIQTQFIALGKKVQVEVIDDGLGIPDSERDRVFEPFYSTQKGGVGLGLFLCQSFVRNHQGEISIDRGDAGGTKVTVTLPVIQDPSP